MAQTIIPTALMALLTSTALAQQFVQYSGSDTTYTYNGVNVTGDDTSVQRFDAILAPGTISQHVHQVFGASGMSPDMTYDSLLQSSCTNVGGAGDAGSNSQDLSVYWHPALYMEAKDGSGFVRIPTVGHKLYYLDSGSTKDQKRSPFEFPKGFRMLAGNPFMRAAATDVQQQKIAQWICHGTEGRANEYSSNAGPDGGFPTGVVHCAAYPFFNGAVNFPHCWNGNDFDQSNPTAHMSYPTGDIVHGDCPSTHPIRLPHLFIENEFNLEPFVDLVKPDSFTLAQGDPTGYGFHMDFYNGWEEGALAYLLSPAGCSQGQYGNEDIGLCSGFKKGSVKTSDCTMKTTFVEKVNTPGQLLVGCNPVIKDQNPAPIYANALLGVISDVCTLASAAGNVTGGGLGSAVSSVASGLLGGATSALSNLAGGFSAASTSSSPQAAAAAATTAATTLATSVKPSAAASTSSSASASQGTSTAGSSLCPSQNGQTFTDSASGKSFVIECGVDHQAGDMGMKQISVHGNLSDCIATCAATAGCIDVSLSGVACYMKKTLGAAQNNAGVQGARLVGASSAGSTATSATSTTTAIAAAGKNVAAAGGADEIVTVTSNDIQYVTETQTATAYQQIKARHAHAQMHARAAGALGAKYHVGNLAF